MVQRPAARQSMANLGCTTLRSRHRKWSIRRDYSHSRKATMLIRAIFLLALLVLGNSWLFAAPECPVSVIPSKAPIQIVDWYDQFILPLRTLAGAPDATRPSKEQVEGMVEKMDGFHRRGVTNPLMFEALVQQISAKYVNDGDFRGLASPVAEKIYKPGSGPELDFSAMCTDTRRTTFPDDTFAITLFGVNQHNCSRYSLRGLVFTSTLTNGAVNGECRPDYIFYRMLIVPVNAGTNTITLVCSKAAGGCLRR
jgi:hypothetical protein